MATLEQLRKDINDLDQQLMELLNRRFDISLAVGALKEQQNLPVYDETREQLIFDKTASFSHSPQLKEVYKTIMEQSKELQRK